MAMRRFFEMRGLTALGAVSLGFSAGAVVSLTPDAARAQTCGAVVAGVVNCEGVAPGGLSFTSGVNTLNVVDDGGGVVDVDPNGTIGIELLATGGGGGGGIVIDDGVVTIDFEIDPMTVVQNAVATANGTLFETTTMVGPDTVDVGVVDQGGGSYQFFNLATGDLVGAVFDDATFESLIETELVATTVSFDIDDDNDNMTADVSVQVLAEDTGSGLQRAFFEGDRVVIVEADGSYTLWDTTDNMIVENYDETEFGDLNAYLSAQGAFTPGAGTTVTGGLTLNNDSDPESFTTDGAHGVFVRSRGGDGGDGGVVNIIFIAEFGKDGDNGGGASSAAVNNGGVIIVNGATANQYGVAAISRGGDGGDGGGFGALFASAGAGGDGGDAGGVAVSLSATSDIQTANDGGHGVFALAQGGDGGSGGSAGGAVVLGDKGGAGGNGFSGDSEVFVSNAGSITTGVGYVTSADGGDFAHGIYAASIGGGAGSGSDVGGIVAIGGRGGGATAGGTVRVSNSGTIGTAGEGSFGILAQSIGGGGGDGGSTGGLVSVGGGAGSGGNAGLVDIDLATGSVISTAGRGSVGVAAQSIGGGGGNGGDSVAVGAFFSVGVGGSGGSGGQGGVVTVDADGTITTLGDEAEGVLAQSIGGGGGRGGWAVAVSAGAFVSASVGIGGDGGAGGSASAVTVASDANITTGDAMAGTGFRSHGLVAQSIGGGGGTGGLAVAVALSAGFGGSVSAGVSLGGGGGVGGAGSTVSVTNSGVIKTAGDAANGVVAQSIGGGGGAGGAAVSGTGTISDQVAVSASVALGGDGGKGGQADAVLVCNGSFAAVSILDGCGDPSGVNDPTDLNGPGDIVTTGDNASGIVAQSIGGQGGAGGTSVAASLTASGNVAVSANVSLGGKGGLGGLGGSVTVNNDGDIFTSGDGSRGVIAQSIGGGGGAGGAAVAAGMTIGGGASATVNVGLGGEGGDTVDTVDAGDDGAAMKVTVLNNGRIATTGSDAAGIVAQSIGGQGGAGGLSVAAGLTISGSNAATVGVSLGGLGGVGGTGGAVEVTNTGAISTTQARSSGIIAQSLGGGGGAGGMAIAAGLTASGSASGTINVGLGGDGGGEGAATTVTVNNSGIIGTGGADAAGIVAQSIGGQGGSGGMSVTGGINISGSNSATIGVSLGGGGGTGGDGGQVSVINSAAITTTNDRAGGIIAQSIGGGGGAGGTSIAGGLTVGSSASATINVAVGGQGGGAGTASTVTVANSAAIMTGGFDAAGIAAQSIGGQGGAGGMSIAGGLTLASAPAATVSVAVGGAGGTAGASGAVSVSNRASITTTGARSAGVLAQSIGGEGGSGGLAIGAGATLSSGVSGTASVAVGGGGSTGGTAQSVLVCNGALVDGSSCGALTGGSTILTSGDGSAGVLAQSIGGEGGAGGMAVAAAVNVSTDISGAVSVGVGGKGGGGGASGAVTVDNAFTVVTEGARASGIVAQSIGGNGGAGGTSVAGSVTASEDLTAAIGVSVAGDGAAGGSAMAVTVTNTGSISTGFTANTSTPTGAGNSSGILAQSIGGSGGAGGLSIAGALTISLDNSASVGVSVGGSGAVGGTSGAVTVDNSASMIMTGGAFSSGVTAQSIAGDGGAGGGSMAFSATLAVDADFAGSIAVAVGGPGGAAAAADDVTVTQEGAIFTAGVGSYGVVGQSIGGSGGTGGFSLTAAITAGDVENTGAVGVSVGGAGGEGGDAGVVDVLIGVVQTEGAGTADRTDDVFEAASSSSAITTTGDLATAVVAQSIGGGGGAGGSAATYTGSLNFSNDANIGVNVGVAVGGTGAMGGVAEEVRVVTAGDITTGGNLAYGVLAQSIGGAGGSGGSALGIVGNFNFVDDDQSDLQVSVTVGGAAGGGGTSDLVDVTNAGVIQTGVVYTSNGGDVTPTYTDALFSHGVVAQSIGGNGGVGGSSASTLYTDEDAGSSLFVNVAVGGQGGAGAAGGAVKVTNDGEIWTFGEQSYGVLAQSIGGSGGFGGDASVDNETFGVQYAVSAVVAQFTNDGVSSVSFDTSPPDDDDSFSLSLGVAVGGNGGMGDIGQAVEVANTNLIVTFGVGSHGIVAQSIGGGGGVGGTASSTSTGLSDAATGDAGIFVGGNGGVGNNGGTVTVTNSGVINTINDGAAGIFAQSIGGGGGAGGDARGASLARSTSLNFSSSTPVELDVTVGGAGMGGGDGAKVLVTNEAAGEIVTLGTLSYGIFAQSIGGGGGDGGSAGISGEAMAEIRIDDTSNPINTANSVSLSVNVGGAAGAAGDGGDVMVINDGTIIALGAQSTPIFAQSVGGGGGVGGQASGNYSGEIGIGGGSSGTGDIGSVTVINNGTIITAASFSRPVFAQSVGGGGGIGGGQDFGQINGLRPTIFSALVGADPSGAVQSALDIYAVDNELPRFNVVVGADGSGDGKDVLLECEMGMGCPGATTPISYTTSGDGSHAIFAQSVGGGGGVGGEGLIGNIGSITFGGGTGDGGDVTVLYVGDLTTTGAGAYGVFAQSVGGGGGVAGDTTFGIVRTGTSSPGANDSFYPDPPALSGDGGAVTVTTNGDIWVTGGAPDDDDLDAGSVGIFAQSVGGGGGVASDGLTLNLDEAIYGNLDNDDSMDTIVAVTVHVGQAFAGSLGGGDGSGGAVDVDHTGSVVSPSWNGFGVFAQSRGPDGAGPITVDLFSGGDLVASNIPLNADVGGNFNTILGPLVGYNTIVVGGDGDDTNLAAAIFVDGGDSNTIAIGSGVFVFANSDRAITGTDGSEAASSFGSVAGDIDLGDGAGQSFTNEVGGAFYSRSIIDVGADGTFTNAGILVPGAETALAQTSDNLLFVDLTLQQLEVTDVTGSVALLETSDVFVEVGFGVDGPDDGDLYTVSGATVGGGEITPYLFNLASSSTYVPVFDTAGATDASSINMTAIDTVVVDYSVAIDTVDGAGVSTINVDVEGGAPVGGGSGESLGLIMEVDFSIDGMNRNQTEVGDYINRVLGGEGSEPLGDLFALIANVGPEGDPDAEALVIDYIDRLTIEGYAATRVEALFAGRGFARSMLDCERITPTALGLERGECFWLSASGSEFERESGFEYDFLDSQSFAIEGGLRASLDQNWSVGVGAGYEDRTLSLRDRFTSEGERLHAGLQVVYTDGPLQLGLVASAARGDFSDTRTIGIEGVVLGEPISIGTAEAQEDMTQANVMFRASYRVIGGEGEGFYVTPMVDVDASFLHSHETEETGVGPYGVRLPGTSEWVFSATPGVELGGRFAIGDRMVVQPYVRGSATIFSQDDMKIQGAFIGASPSDGVFTNYSGFDQVMGNVNVGLDLVDVSGVNLSLGYEGVFGETTQQHGVTLRAGFDF